MDEFVHYWLPNAAIAGWLLVGLMYLTRRVKQ